MAPLSKTVSPLKMTTQDDDVTSYHNRSAELKERTFSISIPKIIKDIRGLDRSKLVWRNIIIFLVLHATFVFGIYKWITGSPSYQLIAFTFLQGYISGLGITMGAHRLWSHRSYKANFPLRLFLAFGQTLAIQNDIYEWCRDHRVHHKFSETDADPHNAERGFFFSHMGWLMMKKHPDVKEKGKSVDMSDLLEDPIVYYQKKYYIPIVLIVSVIIPTVIPWYYFGDPLQYTFVAVMTRYLFNLHFTWIVNSFAHWVGSKPYDKHIYPVESYFVAIFALGEGWHNYHHVFPYDYRTSELGGHLGLNYTSFIIELFAKIGWAYDLKTVPEELVQRKMKRTGDGTPSISKLKEA